MDHFSKKQWFVIFGIWTVVALFFATNTYFTVADDDYHKNWIKLILFNVPNWYLWALFTPYAIKAVDRFPLLTSKWAWHLIVHVTIGIGALFILSNYRVILSALFWNYFDITEVSLASYLSYFVNRFLSDIPFYMVLIATLTAWRAQQARQEQYMYSTEVRLKNNALENELKEAQLMALRLQLSPHFLFNSLHTVSSLIEEGDKEKAIKMTTRIGDFLRRALAFEKQQFITLEKELEFFDLYLEIEKERFKDRLVVYKEIGDDVMQMVLPNLILQPLIENAIKHGISKKYDAHEITLTIRKELNHLNIRLYNDGPQIIAIKDSKREGVGLANVEKRLQKVYEDNYFFAVRNSDNGKGVTVDLNLPARINLEHE